MSRRGRKARSKQSRQLRNHARFTSEDVWEMMAYLDYCLMFTPDHQRFRDTVTAHLEAHTSKKFTFEQVDHKIQGLWAEEGIDGADHCDHQSIYHRGSKYLRCVQEDPALKAKINARAMEIKHKMAEKYIYSHPRTTRSKGLKHQHIRLGDEVDVRTRRTPRRTGSPGPGTPPENLTNQRGFRYRLLEVPASVSENSEHFCSFRSITSSTTPLGNHNHSHLETDTTRDVSPQSEPTSTSVSTVSTPTVKQERLQLQSIVVTIDSRRSLSPTSEACPERGQSSTDIAGVDVQVERLQKENLWYQQELGRMKEDMADMDRKRRAILTAQSLLSGDAHANEQRLAECWSQIYSLESQVNNKKALLPFTKPGGKQLCRLERLEIVQELDLIDRHLSSVLVFPESKDFCAALGLRDQHSDLTALSQRVSGRSMTVPPCAQFRHIFRSLVSAAIGMWVFESVFQDPYLASCHLREEMLSKLQMQDGEDAARNLDFATNHTLINSKYFQEEVIPNRAAELADRLRHAVNPLLEAEKARSGWPKDISKLWRKRLAPLKYIFEVALKIKTKAIVAQDIFEIVLPAQGDLYDERLMQQENGRPATEVSRVGLTVAPGLQRFEYSKKRVDYKSFRLPVPGTDPGFDVFKKAMVVLDQ